MYIVWIMYTWSVLKVNTNIDFNKPANVEDAVRSMDIIGLNTNNGDSIWIHMKQVSWKIFNIIRSIDVILKLVNYV